MTPQPTKKLSEKKECSIGDDFFWEKDVKATFQRILERIEKEIRWTKSQFRNRDKIKQIIKEEAGF